MSLSQLVPENTKQAQKTALKSFERFLSLKGTSTAVIKGHLSKDSAGNALCFVLEKYAMFLALQEGSQGKVLARNTVLSYFGNVKNWLLDSYATQCKLVDRRLQRMQTTLDKHCARRNGGALVKKAPGCTKNDLKTLVEASHTHAGNPDDYLDSALLVLLWYLFGRSSDALLFKSELVLYPGGVLFLRFNRRKTSTEQGVSLFQDANSYLTCPVHAIAVALAMHTHPCKRIIHQVPGEVERLDQNVEAELDLLQQLVEALEQEAKAVEAPKPRKQSPPGVHSYVNRLLSKLCGITSQESRFVTPGLSSHSFRRGAAQHANADHHLSPHWILDRGGWQLSQMNKGFAYIFNTTQEDQQVARTLSGWGSTHKAHLPDLTRFDTGSRAKIDKFKAAVFASSIGFPDASLNVGQDVLDVLVASLIYNYPDMLERGTNTPYAVRIRHCLASASLHESDLHFWAIEMKKKPQAVAVQDETSDAASSSALLKALQEQTRMFELLSRQYKLVLARVEDLERREAEREAGAIKIGAVESIDAVMDAALAAPHIRKRQSKSLSAAWYEWFSGKIYTTGIKKKKMYEYRHAVGGMLLFLPAGFMLEECSPSFADDCRALGIIAEQNTLHFLKSHGCGARSVGTVVKELRRHYRANNLEDRVAVYKQLRRERRIIEPTPSGLLPSYLHM